MESFNMNHIRVGNARHYFNLLRVPRKLRSELRQQLNENYAVYNPENM